MTSDYSCSTVAAGYAVGLSDFIAWNPSLANASSCSLEANIQYCVQRLSVTAQNITDYCVQWEIPPAGMNCSTFTWTWAVELDSFTNWNPTVGANCTNWQSGTYKDPKA